MLASTLYHIMGNPRYKYDNETRLVHFCLHFEINDKMPVSFHKLDGRWYVKEPAELGTKIPSTSIATTPPPLVSRPRCGRIFIVSWELAVIGRGGKFFSDVGCIICLDTDAITAGKSWIYSTRASRLVLM